MVLSGDELLKMRAVAKEILVTEDVLNYAIKLVSATHPELDGSPEFAKKYIRFGASPRAGQALITAKQLERMMSGKLKLFGKIHLEDLFT